MYVQKSMKALPDSWREIVEKLQAQLGPDARIRTRVIRSMLCISTANMPQPGWRGPIRAASQVALITCTKCGKHGFWGGEEDAYDVLCDEHWFVSRWRVLEESRRVLERMKKGPSR